jgi:hypothetical protein
MHSCPMFQQLRLLILLLPSFGLLLRLRRTCDSIIILELGTLSLVLKSYELPKNWL